MYYAVFRINKMAINIARHSILGTFLEGEVEEHIIELDHTTDLIVDPGGLNYLSASGRFWRYIYSPEKASSASGALYKMLGITKFPRDINRTIKKEGDMIKYHYTDNDFNTWTVLHVASYDFRSSFSFGPSDEEKEKDEHKLSITYAKVFNEALKTDKTRILIPIVSGSIMAGVYKDNIFEMTTNAINLAVQNVGAQRLTRSGKKFYLCTYTKKEYDEIVSNMNTEYPSSESD